VDDGVVSCSTGIHTSPLVALIILYFVDNILITAAQVNGRLGSIVLRSFRPTSKLFYNLLLL
jgi:hypothetical protein